MATAVRGKRTDTTASSRERPVGTLKAVGNEIRQRRKALKMSQSDLEMLTDVSRKTIYAIEHGETNATLETTFKLCEALGIDMLLRPR